MRRKKYEEKNYVSLSAGVAITAYRRKYCKDLAGIFDDRDICIESGRFGADKSAEIFCGVVRSVFG